MNKYVLYIVSVFFFSCVQNENQEKNELPIYGHRDYDESIGDTLYHTVPHFTFENHNKKNFSSKDVKSKIKLVNFFFTSCPSICPAMMKEMKRFQSLNEVDVQMVSITVDPERDSAHKLFRYVKLFELDTVNWDLLTGEKEDIYLLGSRDMFLAVQEDVMAPGGFLHSEKIVLLDNKMRIRGFYNGTDESEVDQLLEDVKILDKEI